MTLLEADTDGVYFSVPEDFTEADERRVVAEVAALLPPLVQLEFEGRYAAMLSHEPKNYALLPYSGPVVLRGVAFRSSRAEPFGEAFLRGALEFMLRGDIIGVRRAYVDAVLALREHRVATAGVSMLTRLTKTPEQYRDVRASRREFVYEALIDSGVAQWRVGQRVRVYRAIGGRPALLPSDLEQSASAFEGTPMPTASAEDPRDYDAEYYVDTLRANFATRLDRALEPEHFDLVFADPRQPSLFTPLLATARPRLTRASTAELLLPPRFR
jgi:DNA polymerase elongation subunit (family B)